MLPHGRSALKYEFKFFREQKDLHARAMWFRFSAMLVAHGIVVAAFAELLFSRPGSQSIAIIPLVLGQALSLFWFWFMQRSHDVDHRLDNRIEWLASQLFIHPVKPERGVWAWVPMYGTVLVFSLVYTALFRFVVHECTALAWAGIIVSFLVQVSIAREIGHLFVKTAGDIRDWPKECRQLPNECRQLKAWVTWLPCLVVSWLKKDWVKLLLCLFVMVSLIVGVYLFVFMGGGIIG